MARAHAMAAGLPDPLPSPPPKPKGPLCAKAGCTREAYQNRDGTYGIYCGRKCEKEDRGAGGPKEVSAVKFQEIKDQFENGFKQGTAPQVDKIYDVYDSGIMDRHEKYAAGIGNVKVFGHGTNPGNKLRRFHQSNTDCKFAGTLCAAKACATCSIIKSGFDVKYATTGRFGMGLYCTATSHKSYAYGNKKAMFVVSVCAGIPELSDKNGPLEAGKHSRVVRPNQGAKANENDDEVIVFESDAIVAKYLIVFK